MFSLAYTRVKDFPGASHDMLYTLTLDFMEMEWENITSKYSVLGESMISVVPFLNNSLGGCVVLLQMSSKSGCLEQWDDPIPKG